MNAITAEQLSRWMVPYSPLDMHPLVVSNSPSGRTHASVKEAVARLTFLTLSMRPGRSLATSWETLVGMSMQSVTKSSKASGRRSMSGMSDRGLIRVLSAALQLVWKEFPVVASSLDPLSIIDSTILKGLADCLGPWLRRARLM